MQPGAAVLRELMVQAAATATISYDPNCRPLLMGDPADVLAGVHELLAVADVVKVSSEDLAWLSPDARPRRSSRTGSVAARPSSRSRSGSDGVLAGTPDGLRVRRPGVLVTVIDTVGAGDTFSGALLAGLHDRGLLGAARPARAAHRRRADAARAAATRRPSPPRSPAPAEGPTRPPAPTSPPATGWSGGSRLRGRRMTAPDPFATRRPRTSQRATAAQREISHPTGWRRAASRAATC